MNLNLGRFKASVNDLRLPVVLEQKTTVDDGQGGQTEAWVPLGTVWARNDTTRSMFVGEGNQMIIQTFHNVTIRHRAGLLSGGKFRFHSQFGTWYIKTVIDPTNDEHWLICTCTEEPA